MTAALPDAVELSAGTLALIAVAGGFGAVLRYVLDAGVRRVVRPRGPLGIFLVNVLASLAIGALAGAGLGAADSQLGLVLAAGLLGGFSTLSTVAVDSAQLSRQRRWRWLALNTVGLLVVSVAACWTARLLFA